jgi:hypothetical protein
VAYDVKNPPMMGCGHAANGSHLLPNGRREPACVICAGLDPGATVVVSKPSLEGRRAYCTYRVGRGNRPHEPGGVPSDWGLWFFEYRQHEDSDYYYCGCWGSN